MQKQRIGHIHWKEKGYQLDGNASTHHNMEFIMLSKNARCLILMIDALMPIQISLIF